MWRESIEKLKASYQAEESWEKKMKCVWLRRKLKLSREEEKISMKLREMSAREACRKWEAKYINEMLYWRRREATNEAEEAHLAISCRNIINASQYHLKAENISWS